MRIEFQQKENGPERLVAEAEILFEGTLDGCKLVGFRLWQSPEGELYVTFPCRATGAGADRRYYDYLRSTDGSGAAVKRVKAWILDSYAASLAADKRE